MSRNQCLIAYDNLLEQGVVTVSNNSFGQPNEDAANPVENGYDWLATDFYKPNELGTVFINLTLPTPRPADYLAFYAHNFHAAPASIQLQYYDGASWLDATAEVTPYNSAPRVIRFVEVTATEWRLRIVAGVELPSLGVVSFGKAMRPAHGVYLNYSEPLVSRAPELINSVSEGGVFLGRSVIHQGFRTNLVLQYARDAWVREIWMPFVRHAECKPFFYLWNTQDYPDEAAFCWAEGEITPPSHTHYGFMGTSFTIRGHTE